jgi:hypothetical protein
MLQHQHWIGQARSERRLTCFKFDCSCTSFHGHVLINIGRAMRSDAKGGYILQGLLLQLIPRHALLFLVVLTALLLLVTLIFILQALVIAACVALALLLFPTIGGVSRTPFPNTSNICDQVRTSSRTDNLVSCSQGYDIFIIQLHCHLLTAGSVAQAKVKQDNTEMDGHPCRPALGW